LWCLRWSKFLDHHDYRVPLYVFSLDCVINFTSMVIWFLVFSWNVLFVKVLGLRLVAEITYLCCRGGHDTGYTCQISKVTRCDVLWWLKRPITCGFISLWASFNASSTVRAFCAKSIFAPYNTPQIINTQTKSCNLHTKTWRTLYHFPFFN